MMNTPTSNHLVPVNIWDNLSQLMCTMCINVLCVFGAPVPPDGAVGELQMLLNKLHLERYEAMFVTEEIDVNILAWQPTVTVNITGTNSSPYSPD